MKKIRKVIVECYKFLISKRVSKYVLTIALCFGALLLFGILDDDTWTNLLSIFFGFIISSLTMGFFTVLFTSLEDKIKVTDDTDYLIKLYEKDDIKKVVNLNGTSCTVAYNPLFINDNHALEVDDNPSQLFELDDFIGENFIDLFNAHRRSKKKNFDTVRLDDFTVINNKLILHTSRSNYYNHLVTNRAVDYILEDDVTLRTFYEYGPKLKPLKQSKMSNHIGVNALVYLKDGEMLLPRRKGNSTISKNQITSALALMLLIPDDGNITTEYLFKDFIYMALEKRVQFKKEWISENDIDIEFLGFGQNPYEGGKPQLYFSIHAKNLDRQTYITHMYQTIKSNDIGIDDDKYVFITAKNGLSFNKNDDIVLEHYYGKVKKGKYIEKKKKATVCFEKSFLANLWHEQELKNKNK